MDKQSYEEAAWELLRMIYLGDLILTKLYLEALMKGQKLTKDLNFSFKLLTLMEDILRMKLEKLNKEAKQEDKAKVLEEFEARANDSEHSERNGEGLPSLLLVFVRHFIDLLFHHVALAEDGGFFYARHFQGGVLDVH